MPNSRVKATAARANVLGSGMIAMLLKKFQSAGACPPLIVSNVTMLILFVTL